MKVGAVWFPPRSSIPSPLKSQLRVVIVVAPWGSELASVKAQATPTVHGPATENPAVGFGLGSTPPSSPQAPTLSRMTVVAASRGIDRIESSQPRVTVCPTGDRRY